MIELNHLYNEDCLETMKRMDDGLVNMWLSGVIDGEGCLSITFNKQRTSLNPMVKINITIAGTSKEFLETIRCIVGSGCINERTFHEEDNNKRSWVYRMPTGTVRKILPNLFLIVKREQKKVLLEALSLIGKTKPPKKRSSLIENRLAELKQELHRLNKRGIR